MELTIILTTTVKVNNNKSYIFQRDVEERRQTYVKSILQWLSKTNFKIVLVENSGYKFDELHNEKELYKDRFEVITFIENEVTCAKHLQNNRSKGDSEIFAIYYAFRNSKLIRKSQDFIIKITGRYFINELEEYLSNIDLKKYDCLRQENADRCEMVGSAYKNCDHIFNHTIIADNYYGHIESIWKNRIAEYENVLICKQFAIEKTQRGGDEYPFYDI